MPSNPLPPIDPLKKQWASYVAQKVKEARESKGLSQRELAHLIGIPRPALTLIEHGKRSIKVDELFAISLTLNLLPAYFLPRYHDLTRRP